MNKSRLLIFVVALLIFTIGLMIIDKESNRALSANFADNVLRPLIGNTKTIWLEAQYFRIIDWKNNLMFKLQPNSNYAMQFDWSGGEVKKSEGLELKSIELKNFPLLEGEGKWQPVKITIFPNETVMARTFVRPDPARPFAVVTLVEIDINKLQMSAVAGIKEPAGKEGRPGPGVIPAEVQRSNNLVAAFNGGFQERDGHYGMIVGQQTYLPLQNNLATLVIDKNSKLKIIDYTGQNLGNDNLVIRQNGDMLVDEGQVVPDKGDKQFGIWGRTTTGNMYTWRSGIGITKTGNLIYAVGSSLIPETLAAALAAGGAITAMQLDINPYWVRFSVFDPLGDGKYKHTSIQKNMYDGGDKFLQGYQKDFFYLYKR